MDATRERMFCQALCGESSISEASKRLVVSLPCTVTSAHCFSGSVDYPELFDNSRLDADEYQKMLWIYNTEVANLSNVLRWMLVKREESSTALNSVQQPSSTALNSVQQAYLQMLSFTVPDVEQRRLLVHPSNSIRTPHASMTRTKVLSLLCSSPDTLPARYLHELCKKFTTASKMYARFAFLPHAKCHPEFHGS
jgi:hypothetical protein